MIRFVEDTHQYFLDDKELISVTTLMQKHGLAPNYDAVPKEVLNAKAERGSLIHKEIEEFIKNGEIGFTNEMLNFKDYVETNNLKILASETIAYNDVVAGTVDLLLENEVIADIKTTATLHKEAISWQLSIYSYLLNNAFTKGLAFHFDKEGKLNVVEIPLKPVAEVERLLECERKGELYKQELTVSKFVLTELAQVEALIKSIEERKKEAEARAVELRTEIMKAMEENGVTSFENDKIKLTYVAPTTRVGINTVKLKKDLPSIYEQYTKTSEVKASLRITLKEEK